MDDASSSPTILAVDLDGTLVRTDLLYEAFWSAFARKWTVPLVALGLLRQGRPKLKHRLAELSRIDIATLPYNEEVLAYVRRWRANGGRAALVTASHQELADKVAAHVGEFDQAYGSSGTANLKGTRKATFLAEKFGEGRFAYIGNSTADLPVWGKASKAITVSASPLLKARVKAVTPDVEHLPGPRARPITYLSGAPTTPVAEEPAGLRADAGGVSVQCRDAHPILVGVRLVLPGRIERLCVQRPAGPVRRSRPPAQAAPPIGVGRASHCSWDIAGAADPCRGPRNRPRRGKAHLPP